MKTNIYLHRYKDDNWDIVKQAEEQGYKNADNLEYLGCEIEMEIEIDEYCNAKILKINGTDISEKEILI